MQGEQQQEGEEAWLPPEVWALIFSFTPRKDRIIASRVCHTWRALALDKERGLLLTCGNNSKGQLGREGQNARETVGLVTAMEHHTVVQVAAGDSYTLALTDKGDVWIFGSIGKGGSLADCTPRRVDTHGNQITKMAAGRAHVLLITVKGEVMSFGFNSNGQLGHGTKEEVLEPKIIELLTGCKAIHIACGTDHSLVATEDSLFAFGGASHGQIGETENSSIPKQIEFFNSMTIIALGAGEYFSMVLTDQGLYSFGTVQYGNLGRTGTAIGRIPSSAFSEQKVVSVACGYFHSLALTEKGVVHVWGNNYWGKLGLREASESDNKTAPAMLTEGFSAPIVQIVASTRHSMALDANGSVYAWGCNKDYQLGMEEDFTAPFYPRKIAKLSSVHVLQLACGKDHTVVLFDVPINLPTSAKKMEVD